MAMTLKTLLLLTVCAFGLANSPATASQQESTVAEVASISGVTGGVSDPALNKAMNLIVESQRANQVKERRQQSHPSVQDRVVRKHTDVDGSLILGGSESIPM